MCSIGGDYSNYHERLLIAKAVDDEHDVTDL
ncbi:MAG: hypothetical protein UZ22_OP11002000614 [Microgenomates bacterium OLB23]|nr:MAG: hypothetical protein UZ22_OP11002000614 [Microgenomates bacterium OLB23]